MATREEVAQAFLDSIKHITQELPELSQGGADYLRAAGDAAYALAQTWATVQVPERPDPIQSALVRNGCVSPPQSMYSANQYHSLITAFGRALLTQIRKLDPNEQVTGSGAPDRG